MCPGKWFLNSSTSPSDQASLFFPCKNPITLKNDKEQTYLHQAVIEKDIGVLKAILKNPWNLDINAKDKDHMTALDYSIYL